MPAAPAGCGFPPVHRALSALRAVRPAGRLRAFRTAPSLPRKALIAMSQDRAAAQPRRTRIRCAALATLLAALALPAAPAAASSIAFIKDGNVWLTSPDGSRMKQVTHDATPDTDYYWPSQADDGTILAKYGDYFVRLRPDGTKIGAPVPAIGSDVRHSGNVTVMAGPASPQISPDGTRFAYWISVRNLVTCPIWDPGCSFDDTDYTVVSHVDRFTPADEFGGIRDYRDPSWIDNSKLLVFNYGLGVKEGAISPVGAGEPGLLQWFDPPDGLPQVGDGRISRQGDKLVALAGTAAFGPAQEHLYFYGIPAAYPSPPVPKCYVAEGVPPSGKFILPSWSPDGTAVAVTESDGIHVFGNIPDLNASSPDCSRITDTLLVNGAAPGWGPADVPADKPPAGDPGSGGGQPPTGGTGRPPTGGSRSPAMDGLVVAARQKGHAVRVRLRVLAAPATVRVRLRGGRRSAVMGSATRRGAAAGTLTLRVPLNRRGRAALAHARALRLSVRVAATAPGTTPATASRAVTLRR